MCVFFIFPINLTWMHKCWLFSIFYCLCAFRPTWHGCTGAGCFGTCSLGRRLLYPKQVCLHHREVRARNIPSNYRKFHWGDIIYWSYDTVSLRVYIYIGKCWPILIFLYLVPPRDTSSNPNPIHPLIALVCHIHLGYHFVCQKWHHWFFSLQLLQSRPACGAASLQVRA